MDNKYLQSIPTHLNGLISIKEWEVQNKLIRPKNPYNFNASVVGTFSEMFTNNSAYNTFEKFASGNIFILANPDGRILIPDDEIDIKDIEHRIVSIVPKPDLPKTITVRAAGSFDISTSFFIQNQVKNLRESGFNVTYKDVHNSLVRVLKKEEDTNDYSTCVTPPVIDTKVLDYIIKISIV